FRALPGKGAVYTVPIDFTRLEEGYSSVLYWLDALSAALENAGTAGMDAILRALTTGGSDRMAERVRPQGTGQALGVVYAVGLHRRDGLDPARSARGRRGPAGRARRPARARLCARGRGRGRAARGRRRDGADDTSEDAAQSRPHLRARMESAVPEAIRRVARH